jgi:hypothetical protein
MAITETTSGAKAPATWRRLFMGYDLKRGKESARYNVAGWGWFLDCAKNNGWEPAGTLSPHQWKKSNGDWNGTYGTNDGQMVTKADALELGNALQRALNKREVPIHLRSWVQDAIKFFHGGHFEIR